MRCLVFGAGAVGGFLGAKLIQAGWQVTFLGRPGTVQAWNDDGLNLITEADTRHHIQNFTAIHRWPPDKSYQPDLILLTVKAFDCSQAAKQIEQVGWQVPLVSFINGVGSEALLRQRLPSTMPVLPATLTTAVERVDQSSIKVTKARGVGLPKSTDFSQPLGSALTANAVKVAFYTDTQSMKWSKLISNLIGSAPAALTGLSVDEIYRHPGLFRLELATLREARRVMISAGHTPLNLPGVPIRWLCQLLFLPAWLLQPLLHRLVATGRGGKRPSMYYDVNRGKTEVKWLHGAVAATADRLDSASPANRFLYEQVKGLPPGSRQPIERLLAQAAAAGVPGLAGYNRPE